MDLFLSQIQQVVLGVVNEFVSVAKPCPYAKRWWTEDLTEFRRNYTAARNTARCYCRQGHPDQVLETIALDAKYRFFKTMKRQKKRYWEDFLDNLNNIWQIAKYLDNGKGVIFSSILVMVNLAGELVQENNEISEVLLASFFLSLSDYSFLDPIIEFNQFQMILITEEEIR